MHYSDSRSKTTIFIEKLMENLFQKVVPCFYESFNAILLNNMRLFLYKKGNFLPSVNSSNFQDGGPCRGCEMHDGISARNGTRNQCDCKGKTQNNSFFRDNWVVNKNEEHL